VAAFLLGSCGGSSPRTAQPIGNQAMVNEPTGLAIGAYTCRIQESGYDYPPFRCVVTLDGGRYTLEKVEGSVRFRGVVAETPAGFRFEGEVFCPWGDCTEPVSGEFQQNGTTYVANFAARRSGPAMTVILEPASGYGGDSYGGYGYGGDDYGGYGYGGYGYGGY